MPNPNYMESQKELAWQMRGILTDWLIQVHVRFRLLPETLFLCVNIIDRFLSARVVSLAKLQLVGITCMFIAAKFEEIVSPSVSHFLLCADSSYTESEILQAERYVLKTLDWNLSYPNPVHYLRRISKADDYNVKVRTLAKYLLEIGVLEWRLIAAPPSLMAAGAIWLARMALGMEQWVRSFFNFVPRFWAIFPCRRRTWLITRRIKRAPWFPQQIWCWTIYLSQSDMNLSTKNMLESVSTRSANLVNF